MVQGFSYEFAQSTLHGTGLCPSPLSALYSPGFFIDYSKARGRLYQSRGHSCVRLPLCCWLRLSIFSHFQATPRDNLRNSCSFRQTPRVRRRSLARRSCTVQRSLRLPCTLRPIATKARKAQPHLLRFRSVLV